MISWARVRRIPFVFSTMPILVWRLAGQGKPFMPRYFRDSWSFVLENSRSYFKVCGDKWMLHQTVSMALEMSLWSRYRSKTVEQIEVQMQTKWRIGLFSSSEIYKMSTCTIWLNFARIFYIVLGRIGFPVDLHEEHFLTTDLIDCFICFVKMLERFQIVSMSSKVNWKYLWSFIASSFETFPFDVSGSSVFSLSRVTTTSVRNALCLLYLFEQQKKYVRRDQSSWSSVYVGNTRSEEIFGILRMFYFPNWLDLWRTLFPKRRNSSPGVMYNEMTTTLSLRSRMGMYHIAKNRDASLQDGP